MRKFGRGAVFVSALLLSLRVITLCGAAEDAVCFVLKEYGGKIALFSENTEEPLAVYDTPLTSLYPADIELLREGIRLRNRAEVARLIEDLGVE